jgi:hypothetical protein
MVYVAARANFESRLARLMVSVPLVASHVAILTVPNNIATLQFASLYVMFWMLIWRPASRLGETIALTVTIVAGLTTILTLALIPLAILRIYALRDRSSWRVVVATVLPALVQCLALVSGVSSREGLSHPRWNPVWALSEYVLWGVPYSVLGERWLMPPAVGLNLPPDSPQKIQNGLVHGTLLILAWLIVFAILGVAIARISRPMWTFGAVAAMCSFGMFALELMAMGFPGNDFLIKEVYLLGIERYLLAPGLMLVVALTALLLPPPEAYRFQSMKGTVPLVAFATLLAVACLGGLRVESPRSMMDPWSDVVQQARTECVTTRAGYVEKQYGARVWFPSVRFPCKKIINEP